jgi:hypothetical protein
MAAGRPLQGTWWRMWRLPVCSTHPTNPRACLGNPTDYVRSGQFRVYRMSNPDALIEAFLKSNLVKPAHSLPIGVRRCHRWKAATTLISPPPTRCGTAISAVRSASEKKPSSPRCPTYCRLAHAADDATWYSARPSPGGGSDRPERRSAEFRRARLALPDAYTTTTLNADAAHAVGRVRRHRRHAIS